MNQNNNNSQNRINRNYQDSQRRSSRPSSASYRKPSKSKKRSIYISNGLHGRKLVVNGRKINIKKLGLAALCLIVIIVIIIVVVSCSSSGSAVKNDNAVTAVNSKQLSIPVESETVTVNELYTYGTHFNLIGTLPDSLKGKTNTELVLYSDDNVVTVPLTVTASDFCISESINDGLYLDDIERGEYLMFFRLSDGSSTDSGDELDGYKYFALNNTTDYAETTYYTFSKYNNKIVIDSDSDYSTLQMHVTENTDDDVYDVVLDAGHGGDDVGSEGWNGYQETDFLLPLTLKIKKLLEDGGLKVALTRSDDEETLANYGPDGRVTRACASKAKYCFSIHMNAEGEGGLEIYAAPDMDYSFAETLRDSIQKATGISDGYKKYMKVEECIYNSTFTEDDVEDAIEDYTDKGITPYDVVEGISYHFMIRETGGIVTGAYVDDRNGEAKENPYWDSNTGLETYITELGYLTVQEDVELMVNNMDDYAEGYAEAILTLLD